MAGNVWYGFYYPQNNTYYAFDKKDLPKPFRKMFVGQILPMLWDTTVWDAQCILISNKEAVDQLIEDLIHGVRTIASLNLDEMTLKKTPSRGSKTPKRKLASTKQRSSGNPAKRKAEEKNDGKENIGSNMDTDNASSEETLKDDKESKNEEYESKNEKRGIDREAVEAMKSDEEAREKEDKKGRDELPGSSRRGMETSARIVKKDSHVDENVLRYHEAARQLTAAEDEFEEFKRMMSSSLSEGVEKMYQARIYHQACFSAMSEEHKARVRRELEMAYEKKYI